MPFHGLERIILTFECFDKAKTLGRPCIKKPIEVHALEVNESFRVKSLEGNYKQGKPGDYLMTGIEGERYICDRTIHIKTYDFL